MITQPKKNDIPDLPLALEVNVTQNNDKTLTVNPLKIIEGYAPDYQLDIPQGFYRIELYQKGKRLFEGKTPSQKLILDETQLSNESHESVLKEEALGTYPLFLPYFKNADRLIIKNQDDTEVLSVELDELEAPPISKEACGDGICTDNENLFLCYSDCRSILQTIKK